MDKKKPRKQQILEALATELENSPGKRITTATLARTVGVSEAALYRHFASKAKMFEGLICFAEESIFTRINQIVETESDTRLRCGHILYLLLIFAERNPGITRILLGDALIGETERLQTRVEQFFARIETQFRQILRESRLRDESGISSTPEVGAGLMLALVEGRLHQFLRTHFKTSPTDQWEGQWAILEAGLFSPPVQQGGSTC